MRRYLLAILLIVAGPFSTVFAAEPSVLDIAEVMNDGVEDDGGSQILEVQNVEIVKGGETSHGDVLYICDATINWRIDRDEMIPLFEYQMKNRTQQGGFLGNMTTSLGAIALQQLPQFQKGDKVKSIRFRVRIEGAGGDWIATSSKVIERLPQPDKK